MTMDGAHLMTPTLSKPDWRMQAKRREGRTTTNCLAECMQLNLWRVQKSSGGQGQMKDDCG